MFNEGVGLASAAVLTFIPMHVFYSGKIMNDVLSMLFITISVLCLWKGFEYNKNLYKLLFGFFFALSVLSRYTALWMAPVFLAYFVQKEGISFVKNKHLYYAIGIFFVVLSPWLVYGYHVYDNFFGAFLHGLRASHYWGGVQPGYFYFQYSWQMFSIFGLILLVGLAYMAKKREIMKRRSVFLILWAFIILIFAIIMPHKEDRFIMPLVPPMCILSGYLLSRLNYNYKKVIIVIVILISLVSLAFLFSFNRVYNGNTGCFLDSTNYLNSISDNPLIVSENSALFYFYTHRESAFFPQLTEESFRKVEQEHSDRKIYFVFTKYESGMTMQEFEKLRGILSQNYTLVHECSEDKEHNFIYSNR